MTELKMVFQHKKIFPWLSDNLVATSLVVLTIAGPLRVIYALDFTIYYLSIAILMFFAFFKLLLAPKINKHVAIYILLAWFLIGWLIFSITWSSPASTWKTDQFMIISLLAIITLAGFLVKRSTIERYLIYLIIGTFFVTLFVLKETGGLLNISGYGTRVNEAYLTLSLPQGLALAISVFHFAKSSFKIKLFWLFSSMFFVLGLGVGLARGSLVFSFFAIAVVSLFYLWYYQGSFYKKIKEYGKYIFAMTIFLGGLLFVAFNVKRTASRLARMIDISGELLGGGRGSLWSSAWQGIGEAPIIGHGLGMNSVIVGSYPHNLFLQVWIDGGIIAVLLLFLLLLLPVILFLKKFKNHYKDPKFLSLFSIIIILTLEFSKSFDFYSARSLVIVLILGFSYVALKEKVVHAGRRFKAG